MNAPRHTVSDERLLAYAAGGLSAPEAVVVAAHLSFRPRAATFARRLQAVGGELLREVKPEPMGENALADVLARTEVDAGAARTPAPLNVSSTICDCAIRSNSSVTAATCRISCSVHVCSCCRPTSRVCPSR